jgi:2-amino-4-hydroxy-6-hydroxymethyldihydropteridine diphosphokinase / dihydropteroate synthase
MIILGLGCNVGDRLANLRDVLARIRLIPELEVERISPVYESDALLLEGAPEVWNQPFLNLALGIATRLRPLQLLDRIKSIEAAMGRVVGAKWSPRIIDIDILAWNEEYCQIDKLTIPHPGLLERPFALWPLADIAPEWKYCEPDSSYTGKSARELVKKFGSRFDGKAPLHTVQIAHRIDTPLMMGVLNLTPDSFSDGGKFDSFALVSEQAKKLFNDGADIIDIGAESTRPGSELISVAEEWRRLEPILDAWPSFWLNKDFKPKLSVDTQRSEIAEKLLSYNVDFFNDVSGLVDPKMQDIVKASNAKIIFMHNLGIPANPEVILSYDTDPVSQVHRWGRWQLDNLIRLGINKDRLIFDVGIGFGKDAEQSLSLIYSVKHFQDLGVDILVGHSRKSFLNKFTAKKFVERDLETAVFSGFLATQKVNYLRTHNVDYTMRLLKINASIPFV